MSTAKELRQLDDAQLQTKIAELRAAKFDGRLKHRIGEQSSSAVLETARRDLARALTIETEKKAAKK